MSNITQSSSLPALADGKTCRHVQMLYVTLSIQVIICISGTLSNALACIVIARSKRLHTTFNALVLALAAGDLLASSVTTPLSHLLGQFYLRSVYWLDTPLCNTAIFFLHVPKWHSLLIMTEMPFIRTFGVASRRPWKPSKYVMGGIIIFNIVTTTLYSAYRSFFSKMNICSSLTNADVSGRMTLNVGVFMLFFVILTLAYVWLYVIARKRSAVIAPAMRNNQMGVTRYDIITLRASIIIVVSYVLYHIPYILYSLLLDIGATNDQSYCAHSFVVVFSSMSYVGNTIIVCWTSKDYRKHVLMTLNY